MSGRKRRRKVKNETFEIEDDEVRCEEFENLFSMVDEAFAISH